MFFTTKAVALEGRLILKIYPRFLTSTVKTRHTYRKPKKASVLGKVDQDSRKHFYKKLRSDLSTESVFVFLFFL